VPRPVCRREMANGELAILVEPIRYGQLVI
jgi:hypothetical protein